MLRRVDRSSMTALFVLASIINPTSGSNRPSRDGMAFTVSIPTRHTDTYAATGFVHAGVLLALTELAYAAFERAAGVEKPGQVVAVQVRTRAEYQAPLPWQDGARIEVTTQAATARGFTQTFAIR